MTYFIYQPRTNFSQFGTAALKPTNWTCYWEVLWFLPREPKSTELVAAVTESLLWEIAEHFYFLIFRQSRTCVPFSAILCRFCVHWIDLVKFMKLRILLSISFIFYISKKLSLCILCTLFFTSAKVYTLHKFDRRKFEKVSRMKATRLACCEQREFFPFDFRTR